MKYEKPALTTDDQVALLVHRGMSDDRGKMKSRLSVVNYYRLTGYWHNFRDPGTEHFRAGTCFDHVWDRYVFDRQLRLLVLDGIERIEVAVRTRLANALGLQHGPFGYASDPAALPVDKERKKFQERFEQDKRWSKEIFVDHFKQSYGDEHADLPIWMAVEVVSFGTLTALYGASSRNVRNQVANLFGVPAVAA